MARNRRWYREQIIDQRKTVNLKRDTSLVFRTIDLFEATPKQLREKRSKKNKLTEPKQKKLNTKRRVKYFKALVHCNFDQDDYIMHKTFNREITPDEADKLWRNALERINRKRKKLGLGNARYILVMEGDRDKEKRVHFHIIIDGDLHRDILEETWEKGGIINIDRLKFNEEGITGLLKYITKEKDNEDLEEDEEDGNSKAWRSSRGLIKPKPQVRDCKITKKQVMEWIRNHPSEREIEQLYPGWICTLIQKSYCQEFDKAYMTIEMRRYEKNEKIDENNYIPKEKKRKKREVREGVL